MATVDALGARLVGVHRRVVQLELDGLVLFEQSADRLEHPRPFDRPRRHASADAVVVRVAAVDAVRGRGDRLLYMHFGRASGREGVWQSVWSSGVGVI